MKLISGLGQGLVGREITQDSISSTESYLHLAVGWQGGGGVVVAVGRWMQVRVLSIVHLRCRYLASFDI